MRGEKTLRRAAQMRKHPWGLSGLTDNSAMSQWKTKKRKERKIEHGGEERQASKNEQD